MAGTLKIFTDVSDVRRGLGQAGRDFKRFGDDTEKVMRRVAVAAAAIGAALTAGARSALLEYKEVESVLQRTINLTSQMQNASRQSAYRAGIRDVAVATGTPLASIAQAGYGAISAGVGLGGSDTLAAVRAGGIAASAFGVDPRAGIEYAASVGLQTGGRVGYQRAIDYAALTEARGLTDFSRVATNTPRFLQTGTDLGLRPEEQFAIFAEATKRFGTNEEASTAIARMFEEAIKPNSPFAVRFAAVMGESVQEAIAGGSLFVNLLPEFAARAGPSAIRTTFSARAARAAAIFSQPGTAQNVAGLVGEFGEVGGLAQQAADRRSRTLPGVLEQFSAAVDVFQDTAGERFAPQATTLVRSGLNFLQDDRIINAFTNSVDSLLNASVSLLDVAAVLGPAAANLVNFLAAIPIVGDTNALDVVTAGIGIAGLSAAGAGLWRRTAGARATAKTARANYRKQYAADLRAAEIGQDAAYADWYYNWNNNGVNYADKWQNFMSSAWLPGMMMGVTTGHYFRSNEATRFARRLPQAFEAMTIHQYNTRQALAAKSVSKWSSFKAGFPWMSSVPILGSMSGAGLLTAGGAALGLGVGAWALNRYVWEANAARRQRNERVNRTYGIRHMGGMPVDYDMWISAMQSATGTTPPPLSDEASRAALVGWSVDEYRAHQASLGDLRRAGNMQRPPRFRHSAERIAEDSVLRSMWGRYQGVRDDFDYLYRASHPNARRSEFKRLQGLYPDMSYVGDGTYNHLSSAEEYLQGVAAPYNARVASLRLGSQRANEAEFRRWDRESMSLLRQIRNSSQDAADELSRLNRTVIKSVTKANVVISGRPALANMDR